MWTDSFTSFNLYRELYIYIIPGMSFLIPLIFMLYDIGISIPLDYIIYSSKQGENVSLIFLIAVFFVFIVLCTIIGHAFYNLSSITMKIFYMISRKSYNEISQKKDIIRKIIEYDPTFETFREDIHNYKVEINSVPIYLIIDEVDLLKNSDIHLRYLDRYGTLMSMNKSLSFSFFLLTLIDVSIILTQYLSQNYAENMLVLFVLLVVFTTLSLVFMHRTSILEKDFWDRLIITFLISKNVKP